ncbi:carbamoyltransferase HypF [Fulvivirga sedimenti]|uniref:Carbamoyltransferase n=1 Tax=Fulvivirga sedimenti TaxID=2879465 RepID=A0A9X1HVV1_9BACT|nr:carbamoyltransferase HypF [Fulvivirga sedimenti]MCA6079198.1 carbamoyltransferase HypF [Fulvivirga sedimenti]
MKTVHLHIEGIVQGVGFRPHVYRLAQEFSLNGWVNNAPDGVHIEIQGKPASVQDFLNALRENPPKLSRIINRTETLVARPKFDGFQIIESKDNSEKSVLLTPDYAICTSCEKELFDPENRRFRYPFITCTNCGPRFSIIDGLPYDRIRTTMQPFNMCSECKNEYDDIYDRRYYSQTNSCPVCGITLSIAENGQQPCEVPDIFQRIYSALHEGKIIAVKGIGGFLLLCDASNKESIQLLRQRKGRPSKPLALMYPDEEMLLSDVETTPQQLEAYMSVEAPIVLFNCKGSMESDLQVNEIAPGLTSLGIMRPYAPLLALIARDFGSPLVATSANISGAPIIYNNEQALSSLSWIADLIITHDRDITLPEDDSVIKFTPEHGKRIILRRSRGFAPNYLARKSVSTDPVLSMGASLKSTFALQHGENTYVSQYLGDQDSFDAHESFKHTLGKLAGVLDFTPREILADMHPQYLSTILAEKLAKSHTIPVWKIQHHEAHFAAVLGENGLIESGEPVLGVIWDGTGYGTDGQVWGGEFFNYENHRFSRIGHLAYFAHILGDKMSREPRLSALSLLHGTIAEQAIKDCFNQQEWEYYHKVLRKGDNLQTSSAGRLFDAAACLAGLGYSTTYEGEAAVKLEALAKTASDKKNLRPIDFEQCMSPVYHLLRFHQFLTNKMPTADAAWQFHAGLVQAIHFKARSHNYRKVAFSGGVFQNDVMVDLLVSLMQEKFELYFHEELSPNDENISFGQLIHHGISSSAVAAEEYADNFYEN